MLRFVVLATFVTICTAAGGYGGSSGASYGGSSRGSYGGSAGRSSGMSMGGGGYGSSGGGQVVQAAVQSRHEIQYKDVPSTGSAQPTTIEVGANSVPLNILFRSASSNLNIQQAHDGAQGSTQESESEDEPHVLKHSVTKPIIQEVHEIITPSRKIVQEIQPVQEHVTTIVARGQEQQKDYGSSAGGYGSEKKQMSAYGGSSQGGRKGY